MTEALKTGTRVIDLDGRDWIIRDVVEHNGARWYNCRRSDYGKCFEAARYDSELKIA
jgi:hypothetical protein